MQKKQHEERWLQIAIVARVRELAMNNPAFRYLCAALGGEFSSPGMRVRMKRFGNVAGQPDLMLHLRRGECPGMAIELKTPTAFAKKDHNCSPEQLEFQEWLIQQGWRVLVSCNPDQIIEDIVAYVEGK